MLLDKMHGNSRFSAVLRTENGDTVLPHPCGYFMTRSFYADHQPSLFPPTVVAESEKYREFLRVTRQRSDTGIGYGYALWTSKEAWTPLNRSNRRELHFLLAGIYGDIFFHLGSSSRRPGFHMDYQRRLSLKVAGRLTQLPLLWRLAETITEKYLNRNQRTFRKITVHLRANPTKFIEELRGLTAY